MNPFELFHNYRLLTCVDVLTSIERILTTLSKFILGANQIKLTILDLLEKILNFKTFLLNIIKKKNTFYFEADKLNLVKSWLINHSLEFKTTDTYSNIDKTSFVSYKKSQNIQELLVIEPKTRGVIHIKNSKVNYILGSNYISLFHINKILLNEVLKDIVDYLDCNKQIKIEKYNPKIYKYKTSSDENRKDYTWELENTIFEDVKLYFKKEDKETLLTPFENFYNNQELYNKIGLCYKLVSCFLGGPGLGKTTTVKYLAQKYSKDIYIFGDLNIPVEVFLQLYKIIPQNSIILFDDFDKLSISFTGYVTAILNILDGVLTKHGSSIIFCLNNENFLERNFPTITRIGRIDICQDFNKFDQDIYEEVIKDIYIDFTEEEFNEYINLIKEEETKPQISELKNRCLVASGNLSKAIKNLKTKMNK
jgi:hypothetical protein